MTDIERLKQTFTTIGIKFTVTDDSEDTILETIASDRDVLFMFRRDGSFKKVTAW